VQFGSNKISRSSMLGHAVRCTKPELQSM